VRLPIVWNHWLVFGSSVVFAGFWGMELGYPLGGSSDFDLCLALCCFYSALSCWLAWLVWNRYRLRARWRIDQRRRLSEVVTPWLAEQHGQGWQ